MGCTEEKPVLLYTDNIGSRTFEIYSVMDGSTTKATKTVVKAGRDSIVIFYDVSSRKPNAEGKPLGYSREDYVESFLEGKKRVYAKEFMINEYNNKIMFDSPLTEQVQKEVRGKLGTLYNSIYNEACNAYITKEQKRQY